MADHKYRRRSGFIFNIAAIVEKADENILPAVYFFLGRSLNASLPDLGALTLCRAAVQALASPLCGILGDRYDRTHIVAAGCVLWGVMTSAICLSTTLPQAMVACGVNGFGLALVIPALSSLVADTNEAHSRGKAFGTMTLTSSLGGMAGAFFATNIGGQSLGGIEGWRVAFHVVAGISLATAFLVFRFAHDPARVGHNNVQLNKSGSVLNSEMYSPTNRIGEKTGYTRKEIFSLEGHKQQQQYQQQQQQDQLVPLCSPSGYIDHWDTMDSPGVSPGGQTTQGISVNSRSRSVSVQRRGALESVRAVLRIPSFQVIVLQGIVGSIPWQAMVMFTLWLQLQGFTDLQASSLMAMFSLGCALGSFLGGLLGDAAARRAPRHGRILIAQLSVLTGLPLSVVFLKILPATLPRALFPFGASFLLLGLFISWSGCNNSSIFAEIVPRDLRTQVYAFDRSFEGAVGACGAPLVGIAAERLFGFRGSLATASAGDEMSAVAAVALSNALLLCLVLPWTLCLIFYSFLHSTYPGDKIAAAKALLLRRTGSELELGGKGVGGDGSDNRDFSALLAGSVAQARRRLVE